MKPTPLIVTLMLCVTALTVAQLISEGQSWLLSFLRFC